MGLCNITLALQKYRLRVSSPVLRAHNCTFYKYPGVADVLQVLSKKSNFSATSLYKAIVLMYWDVRL